MTEIRKTKSIVIFAILILLYSACSLNIQPYVRAASKGLEPTTTSPADALIVPNQYPSIEAALGNASAGDTVFVKDGTYYVNTIDISKSINLVGEDPNQTIIDGLRDQNKAFPVPFEQAAVSISASNVGISGFTFRNCFYAISSGYSLSNVKINDNLIVNNNVGLYIQANGKNFAITGNNLANNTEAIDFYSSESEISSNTVSGNGNGISIVGGQQMIIKDNVIRDNSFGLLLEGVSHTGVYGNNIIRNLGYSQGNGQLGYGIEFWISNNSVIYDNNIAENDVGINLRNYELTDLLTLFGFNNTVYHNNLVNNSVNVNVETQYIGKAANIKNGTDNVFWDNGKAGNYWSDYRSKYPDASEVDSSGIGNIPYVINQDNVDHYPLLREVISTAGEPTATTSVLLIAIPSAGAALIGVVSLLVYRRYKVKKEK